MKNILPVLFTILSACGGSGGSSGSSAQSTKALFSKWTNVSNQNGTMDLTGGHFGSFSINIINSGTGGCTCTVTVSGTEAAGNASVASCTPCGTVASCASLNASYTYANSSGQLYLCQGNSCGVYR